VGHHRAAVAAHPVVPKHVQTDVAGALFPLRLRRAELRRGGGGGGGGGGIGISKSTRRRQLAGAGACVVWRTCFIVSGEKLRSPSDELSADSHSAASAAGRAGLAEGDQPSPQSRRVAARCTHSDGSLGGPTSMSGPPLARHSRPRVTKRALILREGPFARGRKRAGNTFSRSSSTSTSPTKYLPLLAIGDMMMMIGGMIECPRSGRLTESL
jgi:hypothetical protein